MLKSIFYRLRLGLRISKVKVNPNSDSLHNDIQGQIFIFSQEGGKILGEIEKF